MNEGLLKLSLVVGFFVCVGWMMQLKFWNLLWG